METKISADKALAVLHAVPTTLRAVAAERDEALSKLAAANSELAKYRRRDHVEKVASLMEAKGIDPNLEPQDRRERLEKAAEEGRLDVIEQAVDLHAANRPLGMLGEEAGNGQDKLTAYLLGDLVG